MDKAIIKEDNFAYCPKCGQCNYQLTDDYKLVNFEGKNYIEFVARCMTDKCNTKFYFQSEITLDKHIRHAFDKNKETIVKEE